MISNLEQRKKFQNSLQEISNSYTRIAAERDLVKDIVAELVDEFELPKKTVNKLARIYHKQNFNQEAQEFSDLEALYEEIVKPANQ